MMYCSFWDKQVKTEYRSALLGSGLRADSRQYCVVQKAKANFAIGPKNAKLGYNFS
jgi:hypothetical protein